MRRSRWLAYCSICLGLLLSVGCGVRGGPATVPVEGIVTYNENPVEGATVTFHAVTQERDSRSSSAVTDQEGRFSIRTYVMGTGYIDGIMPGEYRVTVVKLDES